MEEDWDKFFFEDRKIRRNSDFWNDEKAKAILKELSKLGDEGKYMFYEHMQNQLHYLDDEASRKAINRIADLKEKHRELKKDLKKNKENWDSLTEDVAEMKDWVIRNESNISYLESKTDSEHADWNGYNALLSQAEKDIQTLDERYVELYADMEEVLNEVEGATKSIQALHTQNQEHHKHTLKHYYEMSQMKQNTSKIFNKMISIKSLSLIMMGTILLGGAVGLGIGKFAFAEDGESYIFQPDHISQEKTTFKMRIETAEQVEQIKNLPGFQNPDKIKIGAYLAEPSHGWHISKNNNLNLFRPLPKNKIKTQKYGDFTYIMNTQRLPNEIKVDKLETDEEVKRALFSKNLFDNPNEIEKGKFVRYAKEQKKPFHIIKYTTPSESNEVIRPMYPQEKEFVIDEKI